MKFLGTRRTTALLVVLVSLVAAACEQATPKATTPETPAKASTRCDVDVAISLVDRGPGIHAAIKDSRLYAGGATASAECTSGTGADAQTLAPGIERRLEPASADRITYTLIVVRYPLNTRLYIVRRQADGQTCIVDLTDTCVAVVTELPSEFDVTDLPADVRRLLPASRDPEPETPKTPPARVPTVAGYYVGIATFTPTAHAPDHVRPWTMGGAVTVTQSGATVTSSGEWVDHQGNAEPISDTCTIDADGRCGAVVFSNGRITQEVTHSDGTTRINMAKAAPGTLAPRPPPPTPSSPPASVPNVAGRYEGTLSGTYDGITGSISVTVWVRQHVAAVIGSYQVTYQGRTIPGSSSVTCIIAANGRCDAGDPSITITFSSNSVYIYARGYRYPLIDGGGTLRKWSQLVGQVEG